MIALSENVRELNDSKVNICQIPQEVWLVIVRVPISALYCLITKHHLDLCTVQDEYLTYNA